MPVPRLNAAFYADWPDVSDDEVYATRESSRGTPTSAAVGAT
jgi:hypothetical protein